jgi:carbonic anhydrase
MSPASRLVVAGAVAALVVAPAALRSQSPEFTYTGAHGPSHWSQTPGWEACAGTSARQSPIAIGQAIVDRTLTPLAIHAREAPLALINNGHTVEEEYEPGSEIVVGGVTFDLAQFHFHSPAEHAVHGRHDALELHAVFADAKSSRKVVVAQLFTVGASSPFLAQLLAPGLPAKAGQHVTGPAPINVADAFADLAHYYTYEGSLTTPPCSETVTWFVLQHETQLSQEQARAFHAALGDDARPVQRLNHRTVRVTSTAGSK